VGKKSPAFGSQRVKKSGTLKSVKFLGETIIKQTTFDPNDPNKPFIFIETDGPVEWEK
jgi:hypothetical protein